jgi:hypothetical protein
MVLLRRRVKLSLPLNKLGSPKSDHADGLSLFDADETMYRIFRHGHLSLALTYIINP